MRGEGGSDDVRLSGQCVVMQRMEDGSQSVHQFECTLESCDSLVYLIQSISIDKKDQLALWTLSKAGIKITVEKGKSLQAKAYIKQSGFQSFFIRDAQGIGGEEADSGVDTVQFTVNLPVLLECISIFGEGQFDNKQCQFYLSYDGEGSPLSILLEDQGVMTECEIQTIEGVGMSDFNFRSNSIINRAIINSQYLKDALNDLEVRGSGGTLELFMSPNPPFFTLSVSGEAYSSSVALPRDSGKDVFSVFECTQTRRFRYDFNLFKGCFRALTRAERVSIRMNSVGMIQLQFVIQSIVNPSIQNWINFELCPDELDEEISGSQVNSSI